MCNLMSAGALVRERVHLRAQRPQRDHQLGGGLVAVGVDGFDHGKRPAPQRGAPSAAACAPRPPCLKQVPAQSGSWAVSVAPAGPRQRAGDGHAAPAIGEPHGGGGIGDSPPSRPSRGRYKEDRVPPSAQAIEAVAGAVEQRAVPYCPTALSTTDQSVYRAPSLVAHTMRYGYPREGSGNGGGKRASNLFPFGAT